MKRTVFIALMLICIAYVLLGALLFKLLESSKETDAKKEAKKTFVLEHVAFLQSHQCVTPRDLADYVTQVLDTYDVGVRMRDLVSHNFSKNGTSHGVDVNDVIETWDFSSAIFFCVTVVSTIGYGHMSPKTWGGQLLCIFYALVGIPLFAAWLMAVGERLQIPINKVKKLRPWIKNDPGGRDAKVKSVVCIGSGIMIIIFVPSIAFSITNDWTYLQSVYYAVISITTVGFGDLVPDFQSNYTLPFVRIMLALWILIGLSWCALILNEIGTFMQSQISTHAKNTQERLTHLESVMKKKAESTKHNFNALETKVKEKAQETSDQAHRGYNFMEKIVKKKAQNTKDMIMRKSTSREYNLENEANGTDTPSDPHIDEDIDTEPGTDVGLDERAGSESKESLKSTVVSIEESGELAMSSDPPSPCPNHKPLSKQTSNSTTYTTYDN